MARYIDADKLLEVLNEELMYESAMHTEEHEEYLKKGLRVAINDVKRFPTADVVPKSEYDVVVEKNESLEIELENMRRNLGDAREGWNDAECEVERLREINSLLTEAGQEWQRRYYDAKAEVAREIFEEMGQFCGAYWYKGYTIERYIAELKKKYEENQT